MGMLKHLLVPRKVRHAMHPISTTKHRLTPRAIQDITYTAWEIKHPIRHAVYDAARTKRPKDQTQLASNAIGLIVFIIIFFVIFMALSN